MTAASEVDRSPVPPLMPLPSELRGPLTRHWLRRTVAIAWVFWAAAAILPAVFGLSGAWRAFGAGLIVPGAGLLYAIPPSDHVSGTSHLVGHAVVIVVEVAAVAWALRRFRIAAAAVLVIAVAVIIVGCLAAPAAVIVTGHVTAFVGVLAAAVWAFAFRWISRADIVTLPVIMVLGAGAGAALVTMHSDMGGMHADMGGPMTWMPWGALGLALFASVALLVRAQLVHRAAQARGRDRFDYLVERAKSRPPVRSDVVALSGSADAPEVSEASADELALARHLMSVAMQPSDDWNSFDKELAGPLTVYRYQVNALGWGLAAYNYAHTPSYAGALLDAQAALFDRMQRKAVWGYWYWQNLLGNLDLVKRRADPVDVPQNIMFSGYLNLQLGMFRQATGDARFDADDAITFDWSQQQKYHFGHPRINDIVIRNFGQDTCLWPCEPVPFGRGRKRGFVFPYCNAVATAGVGVMDGLNGTHHAADLAPRLTESLQREFTMADGSLVGFVMSGTGVTLRMLADPANTASVTALLAAHSPELAWRSWEILQREWLDTGDFRVPGSAGMKNADWATNARTNAEALAAAMLLARECGETAWHRELWDAAMDQLDFREEPGVPGVSSFAEASVHANGMIGFGGFGNGRLLGEMSTRPRPAAWTDGPRLAEVPHPDVLVAKAVSDGSALDLVLHPGRGGGRFAVRVDQLVPHRQYTAHGSVDHDVTADAAGQAHMVVELDGRHELRLRPS